MILCIDVDNVLGNLQEVVTNLFNERYGTTYTLDDFTDYNIENVLSVKEAITMKEMYSENGIYNYIKPIAGSQDALQKLINDGHQVYLVTDAIPKIYNEKVEWICHFYPFVDSTHIVAMKHKHLFKCDVMIEDNVQNLIAGVHYNRICMDYPWNRKVHDCAYDIHRCSDWEQVMSIIDKLNEEE